MREPKRLAHRQAERNKARAMKQWSWDDDDVASESSYALGGVAVLEREETLVGADGRPFQF